MNRRVLIPLAIYVAAIAAVFGVLGALVAAEQDGLRRAVLGFFLPDDWIAAGDHLLRGFIRDHRPAMVNLLVSALVVVVPALTFPLKEWASARFEQHLHRDEPDWAAPPEHPLWRQALEEGLLLLIFAALSLTVLRVTVTPGWGRIGYWLTNGVLAFSLAVDFIGPTLSRHRTPPTAIYRILFRYHPLPAILFGAVLSVPPLLAGKLLASGEGGVGAFVALATVNTACIAVAVLWGTGIGTRIVAQAHPPPTRWFAIPFWAIVTLALAINGAFFGGAFKAALDVSPVLKCTWTPAGDGFELDLPGLLDPTLTVELTVDVHNPTRRRARIGDNTVELRHRGDVVAESALPPFDVGPGETARQTLTLNFEPKGVLFDRAGEALADGMENGWWTAAKKAAGGVVDKTAWAVTLTLPLPSGALSVPLYDGSKPPAAPK